MDERKKGTMAGWADEKEGRMAGCGWMDAKKEGWMDGWMDGLPICSHAFKVYLIKDS